MKVTLFIEGASIGPNSKAANRRCREGFSKLLEKCGFNLKMLKLVPCGPRNEAFDQFKIALKEKSSGAHVGMLIDGEEPVKNSEEPWAHLKRSKDNWAQPRGATNDQVFLMTTCMETWIVADQQVLANHYGSHLQASALPSIVNLENRSRQDIQIRLIKATRNCTNAYAKNKRSFEILSKLNPDTLEKHLPSFARTRRILKEKLK